MITWLNRASLKFPPLHQALREPNGLLAAGADLSAERLVAAYRHGCFPWYQDGQPLLWWSPDPRTVLLPNNLHISRSLRKALRSDQFSVTFDRNFAEVIRACAEPRKDKDGTWITSEMQAAYFALHAQGHAHSVEVWQQDQLVGGLYGIAIGQLFFGESMFSRRSDASKMALCALVLWVVKDELRLLGAVAVQRLHGGQVLAGGGGAPCVYGGDGVVVQGCGLLCPVAGCGLVGVVAGVVIGCGVCVEPVLHQAGCFPCGAGKDDVVGADGVGQVVAVYAPVWGVAVVAGGGCGGGCDSGWRLGAYGKYPLPCEHGCASLLQPVVRWLGQDLPYGGAGDECVCVVGVQQQCIAQYAQKYGGAGLVVVEW